MSMAFAVLSHILCNVSEDSVRRQKHLIGLYKGGSRIITEGFDLIKLQHLPYVFGNTGPSKQSRPKADAAERRVMSQEKASAKHMQTELLLQEIK